MALADWSRIKTPTAFTLTTEQKYEGAKSLKVWGAGANAAIVLKASQTAKPTAAMITTWIYNLNNSGWRMPAFIFRLQNATNYYVLYMTYFTDNLTGVYLARVVADNWNEITYTTTTTGLLEAWRHWKANFCEYEGTLYANLYHEADQQWILDAALVDPSPLWPTGGAVGLGNYAYGAYFDLTKIYY